MAQVSDSAKMADAKAALHAAKKSFRQTSPHQIKYGRLNFYPDSGTIFRDGDKERLSEAGIDAFLSLLGCVKEGSRADAPNVGASLTL